MKSLNPEENQELESIEAIFAKKIRNNEINNEIDEIKKWEEKIKGKDLVYRENKYKYDFQQYETIRCFGKSIYTGKINIAKAEMDQSKFFKN